MPNLAKEPRKAISSVAIWPVERKATESLPCFLWIALNFSEKVLAALGQVILSPLRSGVVARSSESRTERASHPFGQAMPRLTG